MTKLLLGAESVIQEQDEPEIEIVEESKEICGLKFSKKDRQHLRRFVRNMLNGCGDSRNPKNETIDQLLIMTVDYIRRLAITANNITRGKGITMPAIEYLIFNDSKKRDKVQQLIKQAVEFEKFQAQNLNLQKLSSKIINQ